MFVRVYKMRLWISFILFYVFLRKVIECKYFADEVNSVIYDLSISGFPLNADAKETETPSDVPNAAPQAQVNEYIFVANKHGQQYKCRVPTFVERNQGSDEGLLDPLHSFKVNNDEIRAALDSLLKKPCMKRTPDWWTYEFCYKDAVFQYHMEGNKKQGELIVLGRFESEKDWSTPEALAELSSTRKKTLYHSHYYTNGTLCDLTDRFRRTEVRFYCDEDLAVLNEAFLLSVDEPESCEYVLTVRVGALCKIPAFLPVDRKPAPLKVECQPALNAHEFEKYVKRQQEEEIKKEKEKADRDRMEVYQKLAESELKKRPDLPATFAKEPIDTRVLFDALDGKWQNLLKTTTYSPLAKILGATTGNKEKAGNRKIDELKSKKDGKSDHSDPTERFGEEGTIEHEFMAQWLEDELKELAMDEGLSATEDMKRNAEKELLDDEKELVNNAIRIARRWRLASNLGKQMDELVAEVLDIIISSFPNLQLTDQQKQAARQEIQLALIKALSYLLYELDSEEESMEILGDKTDLSGLAAFKEMRQRLSSRADFLRELEESGLNGADFMKAKIEAMPKLTDEQLKQLELEEIEETSRQNTASGQDNVILEKSKVEAQTSHKATEETKTSSPDQIAKLKLGNTGRRKQQTQEWLRKNLRGLQSTIGDVETLSDPSAKYHKDTKDELALSDHGKESEKKTLRKEMETQLNEIMEDVERELNQESAAFDDLDENELAEAKSEVFRSLAKTLTNLLEKLDETERVADTTKQQSIQTSTKHLTSGKLLRSKTYAEKKLDIWRKLVKGLDDDTDDEATAGHRPLGQIRMKQDKTKPGDSDGLRVRVSTIKKDDSTATISESTKLERRIADKLKESGFDTQGRTLQVKIITTLDMDGNADDNFMHTLSEEESEQVSNVILSMFSGGGMGQTAAQRRQQSLEASYNFGASSDENVQSNDKKKGTSMQTIVVGGR